MRPATTNGCKRWLNWWGVSVRHPARLCAKRVRRAGTKSPRVASAASWCEGSRPSRSAGAAGKNTRLADLDKAVAEADKKNDAATGLRLSLQALGSQESSEEFPRRLWNAAIYAEWTERQDRKQIDAQVCTELLNVCDQLPPTNKYPVILLNRTWNV